MRATPQVNDAAMLFFIEHYQPLSVTRLDTETTLEQLPSVRRGIYVLLPGDLLQCLCFVRRVHVPEEPPPSGRPAPEAGKRSFLLSDSDKKSLADEIEHLWTRHIMVTYGLKTEITISLAALEAFLCQPGTNAIKH
ncbi:hypothetical protein GCM10010520_15800 [Rhizobium viscosum]|uniref:Uncharacterized protein n=1 Tax=Rhizobium viscosum TaxID=1673 RepID=A0ABR9IXS1_RHIVS|nr:hypothetical protein [Rhizobium viscosum]MBE1507878.1 hypothetical protein [Rhizobium viscosum]